MIAAIVLAAGQSKRMGQPKMLLPWGRTTVLGQVIETLQRVPVPDIVVVTGGEREKVEHLLEPYGVRTIYNEAFAQGEMLSSLQCGLRAQRPQVQAALVCLGDQPQMEADTVRLLCEAYRSRLVGLIVPSYQRRRGHPWLVARLFWDELLAMRAPESPRDFLKRHADDIHYLEWNTPTILQDLDTLNDYLKFRP